jgi:hypothetical protein
MGGQRFDHLTLRLTTRLGRRRMSRALVLFGLGPALGYAPEADAKKKKKKKKRKCKPACTGGAKCQKGRCICPSGRQFCQGVCTLSERVCGEICCPEDLVCFAEGCTCEDFLCNCTAGRTFCSTPDFTQCCLSGDNCDPVVACTTDTCSAGNDVCTAGAAFCGGGDFCLCITRADGEPFCADFDSLESCPPNSECESDGDCGEGETCANVRCCEEESEFFGVCLPECPALRGARADSDDRAGGRQRLERALNLDITWSRPGQ